jgi:P22 coat protein - gene protein 5
VSHSEGDSQTNQGICMALSSKLFSQMVGATLKSLHENTIAPRMINNDFALDLAKEGESISINFPGPVPIRDVVPANVPPVSAEPVNNSVLVRLDNWKEAAFPITDRDISNFSNPKGYIQKQLGQAGRTIANAVDTSVLGLYKRTPFGVGTPGVTPFAASTIDWQNADTRLIQNLCDPDMKGIVMDPIAYGNVRGLNVFQNNQAFGGQVIKDGRLTDALGYTWGYDQNIPTHTRGALGGVPLVNLVQAVGTTLVNTDGWTASVANILRAGDIVTFAGDPNPYVVTADCASTAGGVVNIPIYNGYADNPNSGLLVASVDNAAVSVVASHKVNLALHPSFATIVSRIPDLLTIEGMGKKHAFRTTWVDPVLGMAFLFKVTEQHWQTEFSVSCLWGVKDVWTQFGVRIYG